MKPDAGSDRASPVLLVQLIGDLTACTLKVLGALYSGSFLLAADALYGISVWYYVLTRRSGTDKLSPGAVIPLGLVLAAAAAGICWSGTGVLLAAHQRIQLAGPRSTAVLTAAVVLLFTYLYEAVSRPILRRGQRYSAMRDVLFARGVSRGTLLLLVVARLTERWSGIIDSAGAMVFAAILMIICVRIVYHYTIFLFTPKDTEEFYDS